MLSLTTPLSQDPKMYVHALLEVHNKYSAMVANAFSGDAGFMQALDKVMPPPPPPPIL